MAQPMNNSGVFELEDLKLGDVWRHALIGRTSVVIRNHRHTIALWKGIGVIDWSIKR